MKKLDIVALITGLSSLILSILFFVLFAVTGVKSFVKDGGIDSIKHFFQETKEMIFDDEGNANLVNVEDGNVKVKVGTEGIYVDNGDDKVVINTSGIKVSESDE